MYYKIVNNVSEKIENIKKDPIIDLFVNIYKISYNDIKYIDESSIVLTKPIKVTMQNEQQGTTYRVDINKISCVAVETLFPHTNYYYDAVGGRVIELSFHKDKIDGLLRLYPFEVANARYNIDKATPGIILPTFIREEYLAGEWCATCAISLASMLLGNNKYLVDICIGGINSQSRDFLENANKLLELVGERLP